MTEEQKKRLESDAESFVEDLLKQIEENDDTIKSMSESLEEITAANVQLTEHHVSIEKEMFGLNESNVDLNSRIISYESLIRDHEVAIAGLIARVPPISKEEYLIRQARVAALLQSKEEIEKQLAELQ